MQCGAEHQAARHHTEGTGGAARHAGCSGQMRPCVTARRRRQGSVGQVRECTGPAMPQHTYTQRAHNTHSPARLPVPVGRHPGLLPFGNSAFGTPHHTTPHHTTPHHTTPHHTTPHHTTPHHITPHHATSHHTTPHHTTPQHTTPHHTTPHHTTPHYTTMSGNGPSSTCTRGEAPMWGLGRHKSKASGGTPQSLSSSQQSSQQHSCRWLIWGEQDHTIRGQGSSDKCCQHAKTRTWHHESPSPRMLLGVTSGKCCWSHSPNITHDDGQEISIKLCPACQKYACAIMFVCLIFRPI